MMAAMIVSLTRVLALSLLTSHVAAHGYIQGIVAGGVFYQGYRPSFQWLTDPPQVAGWSDPANIDNGPVYNYTSPDIVCHLGATPGQTYATVQAGESIELQWTPWPVGHLGPVVTYLANCNGECTTVDKTNLLFNKIDETGLMKGGYPPGKWAVDELVANNNSWTLTIPNSIAPGNYVLRNEIIALQEAQSVGGAQNYPQCVNIKVTGSGTNSLQTGTKATQLYTTQDPGILINIYQALSSYIIPGPPILGSVPANATQRSLNTAVTTTGLYLDTTSTSGPTYASTFSLATTTTSTSTVSIASTSVPSTASTRFVTITRDSSFSSASSHISQYRSTFRPSTVTKTVEESMYFAISNTSQLSSTGTGSVTESISILTGAGKTTDAGYRLAYATGSSHRTFRATTSSTGTVSGPKINTTVGFVGIDNGFRSKRGMRRSYWGRN